VGTSRTTFQGRIGLKNISRQGIILLSALWIISILTILAVSVSRQASMAIKLASYDVDRQKAYLIARAGMLRALSEKMMEYETGMSVDIDALSQSWANNKELFHEHELGEGTYTIYYEYPVLGSGGSGFPVLYGLMDEQSKININTADENTLMNILLYIGLQQNQAMQIAGSIVDWRDSDGTIASSSAGLLYGAENDYYQGLDPAYMCKNADFNHINELSVVRGVTKDIMDKIKPYITVYGNGKVNINTASGPVLNALIGPGFPDLAEKIVDYIAGADKEIATRDDRWFSLGPVVIDRKRDGFVEIKNLQDAQWYANIYGIRTEEYNRLKELASGINPVFSASSDVYRLRVLSEVKKVKVQLEAVYDFTQDKESAKIKFWYQD
jgi:type II secretory pathway component PulK